MSRIEQSLDVDMVSVDRGGFRYTAARNAPSLPATVGEPVQAIAGLQPFRQVHKHAKRQLPQGGNRSGFGAVAVGAPEPAPNIANAPPYLAREILAAYEADGAHVDGSGQTIAILIDTFPLDSDLQLFWKHNDLGVHLDQIRVQAALPQTDLAVVAPYVLQLMLRNVATNGFTFVDPTTVSNAPGAPPPRLSKPGCILASPSCPANLGSINQYCVYHWMRDAKDGPALQNLAFVDALPRLDEASKATARDEVADFGRGPSLRRSSALTDRKANVRSRFP